MVCLKLCFSFFSNCRYSGTSSPSIRRSAPVHYPQHVRSVSETGRMFNPITQYQHVSSHVGSNSHSLQHHHANGESVTSGSSARLVPYHETTR